MWTLLSEPRSRPTGLKESIVGDLSARAVPILDEATPRWVFAQPHRWNDWYLSEASLDDLVSSAPLVEVLFEDAGR